MRRNIPTERNKEDFPNRKFIRYSESYDFYGVCPHELGVIAETAGAVHKFGGTVMIKCEILDEFLDGFRLDPK